MAGCGRMMVWQRLSDQVLGNIDFVSLGRAATRILASPGHGVSALMRKHLLRVAYASMVSFSIRDESQLCDKGHGCGGHMFRRGDVCAFEVGALRPIRRLEVAPETHKHLK